MDERTFPTSQDKTDIEGRQTLESDRQTNRQSAQALFFANTPEDRLLWEVICGLQEPEV